MPVNPKYKIIFVHIPKTGGTTIEAALGMHGNRQDIGIVPYIEQKKDYNVFFGQGLQHLTASELRQVISSMNFKDYSSGTKYKRFLDRFMNRVGIQNKRDIWNAYFSFSVVRNPYDRLVSYLAWKETKWERKGCLSKKRFEDFVKYELTERNVRKRRHLWPQHLFIYSGEEFMVNRILKYENLPGDFDRLMQKLGIKEVTIYKKRMVSKREHYQAYYSKELYKKVYEYYRIDFEKFGYKPYQ